MKKCALMTCEDLDNFVHDEHILEEALRKQGWEFDWVQWKDSSVDWNQYQCAIIRTTWDYTDDVDLFLKNLNRIKESSCRLFNDLSHIEWNWKKTYLKEMANWGLPTIPTLWKDSFRLDDLEEAFNEFSTDKLVLKPQVGAGSKDTFQVTKNIEQDLKSVIRHPMMIQPFQNRIIENGEYSAHFFNGKHSHTILKKPKSGDYRSQEEFGSFIKEVSVTEKIETLCKSVFKKLEILPLFARVDLLESEQGELQIIELELIEPALYFRMSEGSADRFVSALNQRLD